MCCEPAELRRGRSGCPRRARRGKIDSLRPQGEVRLDNLLPGMAVSVRCPACQRAVLIPMELANREAGTEISCKCLGCGEPIRVKTPLPGSVGDERNERVRATIYVWFLTVGLAGLVWLITLGPFLALPINHPVILILFGLCFAVGAGLTISIWRSAAKE